MKLAHSKFGLRSNPVGAQVMMTWRGRTLLGDVTGASRNHVTGAIVLDVRHFNGEPWPLKPTSWAVDVIGPRFVGPCSICGDGAPVDDDVCADCAESANWSTWPRRRETDMLPATKARVRAFAAARGLSVSDATETLILAGLERRQSQANGARAVNAARTPEQRSEAARRAVAARYARR